MYVAKFKFCPTKFQHTFLIASRLLSLLVFDFLQCNNKNSGFVFFRALVIDTQKWT